MRLVKAPRPKTDKNDDQMKIINPLFLLSLSSKQYVESTCCWVVVSNRSNSNYSSKITVAELLKLNDNNIIDFAAAVFVIVAVVFLGEQHFYNYYYLYQSMPMLLMMFRFQHNFRENDYFPLITFSSAPIYLFLCLPISLSLSLYLSVLFLVVVDGQCPSGLDDVNGWLLACCMHGILHSSFLFLFFFQSSIIPNSVHYI